MLYDIIIPNRIDRYFLQKKRILSFEITPMVTHATLLEFQARTIKIINHQSIVLKDLTTQAQINAIKKISSNIGSYDELIIYLASSTVILKELTLPFVHRDALEMIVPFEAEALLPFALEEAEIDFVITKQDLEKQESTILVAAIRKEDLQNQLQIFEKAELSVDIATIDVFALFELYKNIDQTEIDLAKPKISRYQQFKSELHHTFKKVYAKILKKPINNIPSAHHQFKPLHAKIYIDIGFDVTRVLYMQNQTLQTIRMIPLGLSDIAQQMTTQTNMAYYDIMQQIIHKQHSENLQEPLKNQINVLCEEIKRTMSYFQQQEKDRYITPSEIIFSGFLTSSSDFAIQAQTQLAEKVLVSTSTLAIANLHIECKVDAESIPLLNLATGLSSYFNQSINLLKHRMQKHESTLLNKQIISVICITLICLATTLWRSQTILSAKESAYNVSKKQCIQAVEQRMHLDFAGEKNIKTVVEKAEEKLKTEKNLWLAFASTNQNTLLDYLQDLSVHIDRASLDLYVKQLHLDYEKIMLTGSVKKFEALDVLEEELQELTLLQSLEKPRELSFTLHFKPKKDRS